MAYLNDITQSIPNAYYYDMDSVIDTAYAMGKTAATISLDNVSFTYYHHVHAVTDGAYTTVINNTAGTE